MTELLLQYGLFFAKAVTWVVAIGAVAALLARVVRENRGESGDRLEVKNINERFLQLRDILNSELMSEAEGKREDKQRRAEEKAKRKAESKGEASRARLFVLDFDGDIEASQVGALREEISAILQVAKSDDAVLVRLESAGGIVHGYGLAASQLKRLRDHGLALTVAVDKVAASGGYLMASVAPRILAAPFAVIGSIGVVAQMPNFHRWLDKNDIDIELHTAGDFKRTLTMFGENTEAARTKFRDELNEIHTLFKSFVSDNRSQLGSAEAINQVATGEHWYGTQALTLGLIDEIRTSDDFLLAEVKTRDVFEIRYRARRGLRQQALGVLTRLSRASAARSLRPTALMKSFSQSLS